MERPSRLDERGIDIVRHKNQRRVMIRSFVVVVPDAAPAVQIRLQVSLLVDPALQQPPRTAGAVGIDLAALGRSNLGKTACPIKGSLTICFLPVSSCLSGSAPLTRQRRNSGSPGQQLRPCSLGTARPNSVQPVLKTAGRNMGAET